MRLRWSPLVQAFLAKVQSELASRDRDLADLERLLRELEASKEAAASESARTLKESGEQLRASEQSLKDTVEQLRLAREKVSTTEQLLSNALDERAKATAQLDETLRELEGAQRASSDDEERLAKVQNELVQSNQQRDLVEVEVKRLSERIADLVAQHLHTEAECEALRKELEGAAARHEERLAVQVCTAYSSQGPRCRIFPRVCSPCRSHFPPHPCLPTGRQGGHGSEGDGGRKGGGREG